MAALKAGKLMLRQIHDLASHKVSFGFETTLSGKAYVKLFQQLTRKGYRIRLIFLWLPNADMAIQRVRDRVRQGGHNVPEEDIRRRFGRGLKNLFGTYRFLVDEWQVFDNRNDQPRTIAYGRAEGVAFKDVEFWESVKHLVEGK